MTFLGDLLPNFIHRGVAAAAISPALISKSAESTRLIVGTAERAVRPAPHPHRIDFCTLQASKEFAELRQRHRRFVFPMCAAFFCWFMLFVLLAAYAHDFMIHRLWGLINVGFVLGVLQFASTGAITVAYARFARRTIDPRVAEIQRRVGIARK